MKKKIFITLLTAGSLLSSCQKQILDVDQLDVINLEQYYSNLTDPKAESLIASVYKTAYGVTNNNWYNMMHGYTDDCVGGGGFATALNSSNHTSSSFYTTLYYLNYECNLIIENMSEDSAVKKQVMGEAYFWRAWAYYQLIRGWGTPPLADHVLGSGELSPANGTATELWGYVEQSLEQEYNRLPEKTALGEQRSIGGRVTKGSALALWGKAQVYQSKWGEAAATLKQIIDGGKYDLSPDFTQLYHMAADFSDEYMWEWNSDDNASASTFTNEGDDRGIRMQWNNSYVVVPGGIQERGGTNGEMGKEFYQFLVDRGEKGKPRQMGTVWSYEDVLQRFVDLGLASSLAEAPSAFWKSTAMMPTNEGYFRSKMLIWQEEVFDGWTWLDDMRTKNNWPGMRYADVLLLYAEACVNGGGSTADGLIALNKVRTRAGLSMLGSYTMQDVKDERRAEFSYEGERYNDLIRWGDASTVLGSGNKQTLSFYGYKSGTTNYDVTAVDNPNSTGFTVGKNELFPFPYDELVLNTNLKQNPGW